MAVLSLLIIGYSFWQCTGDTEDYSIITMTGTTSANNLSRTHFYFGSLSEPGDTSAILVSEGDLLYLFTVDDRLNPLAFTRSRRIRIIYVLLQPYPALSAPEGYGKPDKDFMAFDFPVVSGPEGIEVPFCL